MKKFLVFATLVAVCLVGRSHADVVVYDLSGAPGNQASTSGTAAANATAFDLTRGAGLTGTAGANSLNSSGWNDLAATDYLTFGFSVDAGFVGNLTNITFTGRSSGTGPSSLAIRSSLDGFTSNLHTFSQSGTTDTQVNFNASGLGPVTGNIEFRIFSLNNTSAGGGTVGSGGTFRIGSATAGSTTSLTIGGSITAVPEPTAALALVGIVGLIAVGRRRS